MGLSLYMLHGNVSFETGEFRFVRASGQTEDFLLQILHVNPGNINILSAPDLGADVIVDAAHGGCLLYTSRCV